MSSKKPKVAALQMKPTTVTTGFGQGTYNPSTGKAGYTLADPLAQMRDVFYGAAGEFLPTAEQEAYAQQVGDYGMSLFGQATGTNLQQQIADYYNQQQDILAPGRERESAQLADAQFKTGRLGYGTGTQGGYINPQQFALQQARESQNAQMLLGSEDRARAIQQQDINRALGYADSSNALFMQPYSQANTLFGMGTGIEGLGSNVLNTVGQFAPLQMNWQTALQQNQQAMNNAKASGGFMSGLGGSLLNAGLNYATGGVSGAVQGAAGGGGLFSSLANYAMPQLMNAGASLYTGGMSNATSMGGGVGKESWMYSDSNLKTNIRKIGEYKNGLNKYAFTYIWGQDAIGVIAQEAMQVVPKAVRYNNGFLEVNYDLIGE